jgi:hypothetical protein
MLEGQLREDEDKSRVDSPRLLDRVAFKAYIGKVTLYALSMLAPEWEAAKTLSDSEREALDALDGPKCMLACQLPVRYSLPCRHWLYWASQMGISIPLSLSHPRWLIDGSANDAMSWAMGYRDPMASVDEPRGLSLGIIDRYADSGMNLMLKKALASVQIQGELTRQRREQFAKNFSTVVDRLAADFPQQEEQHRRFSVERPRYESPERSTD